MESVARPHTTDVSAAIKLIYPHCILALAVSTVSWQLAVAAMTSLCQVLVLVVAMLAGSGQACLGPIFDVIFPTPAPTTAPPATGLRLSISI